MKKIFLLLTLMMVSVCVAYAEEPQISINLDSEIKIENIPQVDEKGLVVWVSDENEQTLYANLFNGEEYAQGLTLQMKNLVMGDTLNVSLTGAYNMNVVLKYDESLIWADFKQKYDNAKENEVNGLLEEYSSYINSTYLDKYLKLDSASQAKVLAVLINSEITSFEDIKSVIDTQTKKVIDQKNNNTSSSGGGGGGGGGSYNISSPVNATQPPKEEIILNEDEALKAEPFDDMDESHWANESVLLLRALKIVDGDDNNMFHPQKEVSRAEFVKMLVMTFDEPIDDLECTFSDISKDAWYYEYVALAQQYGLSEGNDQNCFMPESRITRQDAVTLMWRFCNFYDKDLTQEDKSVEFTDKEAISSYALEAVEALYKSDIISGMDDGSFAPMGNCTKAMAAHMIANVINREADK